MQIKVKASLAKVLSLYVIKFLWYKKETQAFVAYNEKALCGVGNFHDWNKILTE